MCAITRFVHVNPLFGLSSQKRELKYVWVYVQWLPERSKVSGNCRVCGGDETPRSYRLHGWLAQGCRLFISYRKNREKFLRKLKKTRTVEGWLSYNIFYLLFDKKVLRCQRIPRFWIVCATPNATKSILNSIDSLPTRLEQFSGHVFSMCTQQTSQKSPRFNKPKPIFAESLHLPNIWMRLGTKHANQTNGMNLQEGVLIAYPQL